MIPFKLMQDFAVGKRIVILAELVSNYHYTHLQLSVHKMPAWKHSQYFLVHPDFLHAHPLLGLPTP